MCVNAVGVGFEGEFGWVRSTDGSVGNLPVGCMCVDVV